MRASSSPSRAAIRGNAGSRAGSVVMWRPCAVPATRRITKNGYASNRIDLLTIKQHHSSSDELLATFTYKSGGQRVSRHPIA